MKALKYITLLMFVFLFVACSEESPFEVAEEDLNEAEELAEQKFNSSKSTEYSVSEQEKCRKGTSTYSDDYCCTYYGERCYYYSSSSYMSESDKCYYGTSTYGDDYCCTYYGYRCSYVYSSSSVKTEIAEAHTTKSKTMKFTLTYYKQKSADWDGISTGSYSDGDPTISFTIYFIASGGQSSSQSTGTLLSLQDQGSWSGSKVTSFEVPLGTQDIKICPSVVDKDAFSDDIMSSGYCYTKTNIGYLDNYTSTEQSDYNSSKYTLEWEWYLY